MALNLPIYMDYHATTPMDRRVFEVMVPYFLEKFGNAASHNHAFGWEAKQAVEKARQQVANLIRASAQEIVFTSGGTEGDNLAIKGAAWTHRERGNHIITCVTEHKAVLDACRRLEMEDFQVTYLPVDRSGQVDPEDVRRGIGDKTILVTLMAANNEVGVLHPISEIGRICRERGVLFHCDATQAIGRVPFDVDAMNVDMAAFTAHKFYGPKGAGALYVRQSNRSARETPLITPLLDGGGHERGMRSGTLNVPGIVGLGKACELAQQEKERESRRILFLRDKLKERILSRLDDVYLNGHATERLPGNLNLSFAHVDGQSLMMGLQQVAVSSGAACNSAAHGPSYVLKALGVSDELAESSIRFGLGRFNTEEEVDYVGSRVIETVVQLRDLSLPRDQVIAGSL